MIVADSDVLIDGLSGREPVASRIAELLRARRLATTAISRFELLVGSAGEADGGPVRSLLDAIPTLDLDRTATDRAAEVGSHLASLGTPLPMADLAIAGICLSLDVPLLTRNTKHFERVSGLVLEPI